MAEPEWRGLKAAPLGPGPAETSLREGKRIMISGLFSIQSFYAPVVFMWYVMHYRMLSVSALLVAIVMTLNQPTTAFEVFVSPQGNDSWSGKLEEPNADKTDGPVATLMVARDKVRAFKRKNKNDDEPIFITMRAGTYRQTEPVQLGEADSGTEKSPVVIRAFAGEQPILSGGVEVTGFTPVSSNILSAPLPEAIKDPSLVRLVLFQGRRLPMARWPNVDPKQPIAGGWAYVAGERPAKAWDKVAGETEANRSEFTVRKEDARRWANPAEGELFIFTRFNYWNDLVPIAAVNNALGKIETKEKCSYVIRPGDRYFVQGMREELDAPGEWYIDRNQRQILVCSTSDPSKITLDLCATPILIGMRNDAHHIRIDGLTLQGATGSAISALGAQHCEFINCTVQHTGDISGHGIALVDGGHNRVADCDISDTGGSGVFTSGGDYKTLQPAEHVVQNNHIHHTGVITVRSAGVWLSGVGSSALNNDIHDCPRMGVMMSFGANNQLCTVEYNHIYRVNQQSQDTGAIYASGRDWVSGRGHRIRYNYIHDSLGFGWDGKKWSSPYYAWGIYLDDACSSCDVIGNIIVRCPRAAIMVHSGQSNRIENNIFVDGGLQQIELRGWDSKHSHWLAQQETIEKRYQETKDVPAWKEIRGYKSVQETVSPNGDVMVDNVIRRNIFSYKGREVMYMDVINLPEKRLDCDNNLIFVKGGVPTVLQDEKFKLSWKAWQSLGRDQKSKLGDPKFKDPSKDDYRLNDDSPAFGLGFEAIPVEKIGRLKK